MYENIELWVIIYDLFDIECLIINKIIWIATFNFFIIHEFLSWIYIQVYL